MPKPGSKKFSAKTLKALLHFGAYHVAFPFALEYLTCLGLTWVVSLTLLNDHVNTPKAAVGVWAIGLMLRLFVRPTLVRQPQLNLANTFNAADLAAFAADLEKELAKQQDSGAPSPYL